MPMMKLIKKLFSKKLNNKGVTLVELISALAILSLVGGSVAGIMYISSQTYQRGTLELDVQQEASFATNLINSYVQDAHDVSFDVSSETLTIEHIGSTYAVRFLDSDGDGTKDSLWISNDNFATKQLMAEKVTAFFCDTSRFSYDKSVTVDFKVKSGEKEYKSEYSVTARNADVADETAVVAINAPRAVVLEPNQSYTITPCEVMGAPVGSTLSWEFAGFTPNSYLSGNTINIGNGETNSELNVVGTCKDSGGNVIATTSVKVYIRRVTGVTLSARLVSGTDLSKDAVYEITANITGTNLDEKVMETGYVNPYQVNWYEVFGSPSGWNTGRFEVAGVPVSSGSSFSPPTVKVKLKENMGFGEALTVTADAKHPIGTNKSGSTYATGIRGTWKLQGPAYTYSGSRLYRGTNQAQGDFTYAGTLKSQLHNKYFRDTFFSKMYYRYREVTLSGDRIVSGGAFTEWRVNPGDSDDSMAINLRPTATQVFHPEKAYEIEMCLCIYDYSTNTYVWPGEYKQKGGETLDSAINKMIDNAVNVQGLSRTMFTIKDIMKPVEIDYTLKDLYSWPGTIIPNVSRLGSETNPYILDRNAAYEFVMNTANGIEDNLVKNNLEYVVQQKVGGVWRDVNYEGNRMGDQSFKIGRFRYENGSYIIMAGKDQNNKAYLSSGSTDFRFFAKGRNVDYTVFAGGNTYNHQQGDCDFYNLSTGFGVFYLRFN